MKPTKRQLREMQRATEDFDPPSSDPEEPAENDARDITGYFNLSRKDMPNNLDLRVVEKSAAARSARIRALNKIAGSNG